MFNVREPVKDRGATLYSVSVNHRTHICTGLYQRLNVWYVSQHAKARLTVQLVSHRVTNNGEAYTAGDNRPEDQVYRRELECTIQSLLLSPRRSCCIHDRMLIQLVRLCNGRVGK